MPETLRDLSKRTWTSRDNSLESINAGSLQRIADATERMTQRHTELIRERDDYERRYKAAIAREQQLERQLAASRGQITKLRKAALKDQS